MKPSGLADSPLFSKTTPPSSAPAAERQPVSRSPLEHIRTLYGKPDEQLNNRLPEHLNERPDAQAHNRSPEQLNTRPDEQLHSRSNEHLNERSSAQMTTEPIPKVEHAIHRQSYDIYDDQAEAIEALCLKWRKKRGRHITKGEAMRELLSEILASKS